MRIRVVARRSDVELAALERRVAAGRGVEEARPEVQAGVAGEVGGYEHRPGGPRADHRVDPPECPVECLHDPVAQAIELHVVDRGQEPRLAERVRPRALVLADELVVPVGQGELLERRRCLGEEHAHETLVGEVRQGDLDHLDSEPACGLEGGPVDVGRALALERGRNVAEAKSVGFPRPVEVERGPDRSPVGGVRPVDGGEDEGAVLDASADGSHLVERPAKGHASRAGDAPEGRAQPGRSASLGGRGDGAESLGADGEGAEPRRGGGRGARARSARSFVGIPGVARLSPEPDFAVGEGAEGRLAEEDCPRPAQEFDDPRVAVRGAIAVGRGSPGGQDARRVEEILEPVGNSVEGPEPGPGPQEGVRGVRLGAGELRGDGDEALEPPGVRLDAREVDLGEAPAREIAALDPPRERGNGRVGDVLVGVGQPPRVGGGPADRRLRGRRPETGQTGIETRRGRDAVLEGERPAGAGRLDLAIEVVEHELALLAGVADADEALRGLDDLEGDAGVLHVFLLACGTGADRRRPVSHHETAFQYERALRARPYARRSSAGRDLDPVVPARSPRRGPAALSLVARGGRSGPRRV